MTADVGLASVLSNASYVNQLEHLGTFAFAGKTFRVQSLQALVTRHLEFIHFGLEFIHFKLLCNPVRILISS